MKQKRNVVRRTITLAKEKDDALAKQARRKGMAVPTYFSQLLSEFAEVKIKTAAEA